MPTRTRRRGRMRGTMPRPDDPRIGASSPTDRRGRRPVSVGQNHCDLVGRTGFEPVTSSVSSLKERGRVKWGFTGLLSVFRAVGGMLDWPAGLVWPAWGRGLPCSRLLPVRVSGSWGQGPGGAWLAKPAPSGVLDAPGRDPIIGRRGTGECVVVVVAGPMGSSSAGAPGCGHPSGWPAARGRGAWGWSARAAGSIRAAAAARGGARHGSDHALPAAGPAHLAWGSAAGVSSALTCPSRIA